MNKIQKIILAVILPAICFFITVGVGFSGILDTEYADSISRYFHRYNPFDLKDSWWLWIIYLIIIGITEFKIFRNKKEN